MRIARNGDQVIVSHEGSIWTPVKESVEQLIEGEEPTVVLENPGTEEPSFSLPYTPRTIVGVGLNFRDTVKEMGWDMPERPYLFPKLSSSVTGPTDPIVLDRAITQRADWEGELAVVIGALTRNVSIDEAMNSVFGYISANDVSARDLQAVDGQWLRGKGLDTFCPLGPWIVTQDEITNPHQLRIVTRINGQVVQDGTTDSMIFTIPELIAYCSRYFTLHPGDLLLTGTPAGCGDFQDPPLSLAVGDVVKVEIDGLGCQENPVVGQESF